MRLKHLRLFDADGHAWRRGRAGRHRVLVATALATLCAVHGDAQALNLASTHLPHADGGSTTLFYPTRAAESAITRGPFQLSWANDAQPERGNGRLVVISPGSGGSPWVHVDFARTLVARGFVVAIPQHSGDNVLDSSSPGPESWVKRPGEVSRAIDQIANDPRLSPMVSLDAVGIFDGSAGGHTALSLAGGAWSPARFRDHRLQHEEDFSSCVGFTTLLRWDGLDGFADDEWAGCVSRHGRDKGARISSPGDRTIAAAPKRRSPFHP